PLDRLPADAPRRPSPGASNRALLGREIFRGGAARVREGDALRGGRRGPADRGDVLEPRRLSALRPALQALLRRSELRRSGAAPGAQSARAILSLRRSPGLRPGLSRLLPRRSGAPAGSGGPPAKDCRGDRTDRYRGPRRSRAPQLAPGPGVGPAVGRGQGRRVRRRDRVPAGALRVLGARRAGAGAGQPYGACALSLDETMRELALRISRSSRITVLTGAGVSAASGVPTFRGPEGL